MNRALVYTLNFVLVAVCCFLAAEVVLALVKSATVAPADSAPAPTQPVAKARTWDDRQAILQRNLFDASTITPANEAPAPIESKNYEKTKLQLRLLGTAASIVAEESWAAVENLKAREHLIVRIGDEVLSATVVAIDPRRIVLENRGRHEELALLEDPNTPPRSAARARPPARSGVSRLGRNRFGVDNQQVQDLVNNPAALFSQARIVPHYEDGQMTGIQVNAIKPGSLFAQAGLQDGDTVVELNGIEASSPEGSQKLLQEFRSSQEWTLIVRGRDGAERTLNFETNP